MNLLSNLHLNSCGLVELIIILMKISSGIEVIIHAASDLHTQVADSPASLINSNLLLTTKILEMAAKYNIPRFIYISSCSVYGKACVQQRFLNVAQ